jgi:hypothetical protein
MGLRSRIHRRLDEICGDRQEFRRWTHRLMALTWLMELGIVAALLAR